MKNIKQQWWNWLRVVGVLSIMLITLLGVSCSKTNVAPEDITCVWAKTDSTANLLVDKGLMQPVSDEKGLTGEWSYRSDDSSIIRLIICGTVPPDLKKDGLRVKMTGIYKVPIIYPWIRISASYLKVTDYTIQQ